MKPISCASSAASNSANPSDPETLASMLYALCEKVSGRLKTQELAGRTLTLKLKTADFRARTRARALSEPTQLAARMFGPARELLLKEATGEKFRLIGVGLSDLCAPEDADHGDLVDTGVARVKATEAAMDKLRARFGRDAIVKGIVLPKK